MTSTGREAHRPRSGPPSPSSSLSLPTSDKSGHSTKSACRVCWRHECKLESHREYARRAALPSAQPKSSSRQSSLEQEGETSYPIEMKANMRQLYQHFFTVEIPHGEVIPYPTGVSRNRDLSRKYASLAQECPSLCYSIVSCAASRIASSQGVVDDRALKHYAQAVRSLADTVNRPTTESAILAALTLIQHDLIFFHPSGIGAHIEGIYTMIEKQGGLAYLDGSIGHVAFTCDYQAAVLLDQPPRYHQPTLQNIQPLNAPDITNGQGFLASSVWGVVDNRLRDTIRDICLLVEILDRSRNSPVTMGNYQFFIYKRNVIENSLAQIHAKFRGTGTLNECLSISMIIFQSMTIGGIDNVHGIFDHLVPRFKLAIGDTHVRMGNLWTQELSMAIWLMFVGAAIPDLYKELRKEFLAKAAQMLEASYGMELLQSKSDVRAGLSRYIWCDLMLGRRFNTVWKEIMDISMNKGSTIANSEEEEEEDFDDEPSAASEGAVDDMPSSDGHQFAEHYQGMSDYRGKGKERATGPFDYR